MGVECEFLFESNDSDCIFKCGEVIVGTLRIRTTKPQTVQGIFLRLKGKGTVCYNNLNIVYDGNEDYISLRQYIDLSSTSSGYELIEGVNEYKFQYNVPENFPPSCCFPKGCIGYVFSAYVEKRNSEKKIGKMAVKLLGKLDLSSNPVFRSPIRVEDDKSFLFEKYGLHYKISIPYMGHIAGQSLPFTIFVRNDSAIDCYDSKVELIQYVDYTGTSYGKKNTHTSCIEKLEKRLGPILKISNKQFEDCIDIPSHWPISMLDKSEIIRIFYRLKFTAFVTGLRTNAELECPVAIGSVPIAENSGSCTRSCTGRYSNKPSTGSGKMKNT